VACSGGPGRARHPATAAIAVTGRLTRNTPRQPTVDTSSAATAGPPTPITPHTAELAAKARGRSEAGKATPVPATATEMTNPTATPCRARAATSAAIEGAMAASSDVMAKATVADRYVLRTPTLSMIGPATRVAMAAVSSSAVIVQGSSATSPRSSPISGSAPVIDRLL